MMLGRAYLARAECALLQQECRLTGTGSTNLSFAACNQTLSVNLCICRQFSPSGALPTVKEDLTPEPSTQPSEGVPNIIVAC